jgi:hypothetical protein
MSSKGTTMITDSEFVAIRQFDRTLARNADSAQSIINSKNSKLVALASHADRLQAEVDRLRRELEIERGRRKMAELKLRRQ